MNDVPRFVEECCLVARNARTPALGLYLAYVLWALAAGVAVQDQFTFVEMLKGYGLKYRVRRQVPWFMGIAILPRYRCDLAESPG